MKTYSTMIRDVRAVRWDGTRDLYDVEFSGHGFVVQLGGEPAHDGLHFLILSPPGGGRRVVFPGDWVVEVGPSRFAAMDPAAWEFFTGVGADESR